MSIAPPAVKDGFSYAGDSIYVEASGHNRHRRATIPELKAHFKGTTDVKDPPAHWYEAQLLHYGLPPSKTKGTAKMRLFEAVNKGNMTVPSHIQKLEADLKKEWTRNERGAKKALKQQVTPKSAAAGTKRKAEAVVASATNINLNLSLSVNSAGAIQIQSAEQPKKKTKTTAPTTSEKATKAAKLPATTAKKAPTPKAKESTKAATSTITKKETTKSIRTSKATKSPRATDSKAVTTTFKSAGTKKVDVKAPRKQTAKRGGATVGSKTSGSSNATASSRAPPVPGAKNLARRGGTSTSGMTKGPSMKTQPTLPQAFCTSMKKQTARRGGMNNAGRITNTNTSHSFGTTENTYDEPPPPYSEFPEDDLADSDYYELDDDKYDDDDSDVSRDWTNVAPDYDDDEDWPLAPLGLLNGRYTIHCQPSSVLFFDRPDNQKLILTLDGNSLWGSFDWGDIKGVLHSPERPWQSSHEEIRFAWRGYDSAGNGNDFREVQVADICFLGGARIKGGICSHFSGWSRFHGERVSGQETRSEISASSMRQQWDELPPAY